MEIREVKIEEYWPLIVKNTVEFGQIAAAENPEFNRLAKCIYQVLQESFVHDATEYGVKRWESILGINPASGATLDDRKATILTYLSVKVPYTWRVLKQMLVPILGGEDKFVMEYLNDEAKLVLHTDRLNDAMLATVSDLLERVLPQNVEVMRYNHHIEVSWRNIDKYAKCESVLDIYAVDPENNAQGKDLYPHFTTYDLTSDGEWVYPLPNLKSSGNDDDGYIFGINNKLTKLHIYAPKCTRWVCGAQVCSKLEIVEGNLESVTDAYYGFTSNSKLKSCTLRFPKLRGNNLNMFRDCILDKPSAVGILDSLPAYTYGSHKLTIGIHVDHKTDEGVLAAIANAEAKGWTLSVIWNGTPTSGISTTDLEEIWCKVTESEHGEYVNENGNRCTLDWGHYVTDTSEYKLFYSLVEAEQYFKLTRIENNE